MYHSPGNLSSIMLIFLFLIPASYCNDKTGWGPGNKASGGVFKLIPDSLRKRGKGFRGSLECCNLKSMEFQRHESDWWNAT